MAAAVTEAWPSAGVLRRREPLEVSGRGFGRSRLPRGGRGPGRAWGRPRGRVRERPLLDAAGSGLAPPPQGPEGIREGKGPLSAAGPVTGRTRPSRERPLGLCSDRARERSAVPRVSTSRRLRCSGAETGSGERNPSPGWVCGLGKWDKKRSLSLLKRCSCHCTVCGSGLSEDCILGSSNCWNCLFT